MRHSTTKNRGSPNGTKHWHMNCQTMSEKDLPMYIRLLGKKSEVVHRKSNS